MKKLKLGEKIAWQYTHQNGRSRFERVKTGKFIREIRSPVWIREANQRGMGYPVWCLVHFDGNKNPSRVMRSELRKAK